MFICVYRSTIYTANKRGTREYSKLGEATPALTYVAHESDGKNGFSIVI